MLKKNSFKLSNENDIVLDPFCGSRHISFTCTDMPATEAHLKAHNVDYSIRDLPVLNVKQINFKDPVGNGRLFSIWKMSNSQPLKDKDCFQE